MQIMGIRIVTPENSVKEFLFRAASYLQSAILNALCKLGEECVVKIRMRSAMESWIDHTGNLRSSIGYSVYDHGKKFLSSTFEQVLSGIEGTAKGKKMIEDLAKEYSRVYALVVIAAMEYAAEVEAIESKDVLSSTKIWATAQVEKRVKTAIDYAITEINKWKI